MNRFDVHTKETAQADAAEMLGNIEKAYGFIPNLYGVFAESPSALKGADKLTSRLVLFSVYAKLMWPDRGPAKVPHW